jgi:hypothetical protein
MTLRNFPEIIQGMLAGDVPLPPITRLIGFDLTAAGQGQASFSFHAEPRHANALGTLHGGVLCDVTDMAMGLAYATTLAAGESFTTIESSKVVGRSVSSSATSSTISSDSWPAPAALALRCGARRPRDADR